MELSVGMKNTVEVTVTENLTAAVAKSGGLPVYATPFMIALMEEASAGLIEPYLDEGITSVGTMVNIQHLAATAVGATVKATATLTSFDGRRFCFDIEAFDNAGLIGKGTHERFSVKAEKFMAKCQERANINE